MSRNIIAILRGITPAECSDVCDVLISSGIDKIEVPLNSPDPFESISIMVKLYGQDATIGAEPSPLTLANLWMDSSMLQLVFVFVACVEVK